MTNLPTPTLLITHTDRDGLFSAATVLRALAATQPPELLLTQGMYLASELEDLVRAGRSYRQIVITDTYWHALHGERISASLGALLQPGGEIAWIDHHPSSVEHEAQILGALAQSAKSSIRGDRAGQHEAVSLAAKAFAVEADPIVQLLLKATANGWLRNGEPVPAKVALWLAVVDGLPRFPELPAEHAADIVRCLANGFDTPVPAHLQPLAERTLAVQRNTAALCRLDRWRRLPSVDGGCGVLLDLIREPEVNAYELQIALARMEGSRIDYFIVQESASVVHYVSGPAARRDRDRLESQGSPSLRVGCLHKGRPRGRTWRAIQGIDLAYLTRRQPAAELLGPWINAHPYLVKAPWRSHGPLELRTLNQAADAIGAAMRDMLTSFGWSDQDRGGYGRKPLLEA